MYGESSVIITFDLKGQSQGHWDFEVVYFVNMVHVVKEPS